MLTSGVFLSLIVIAGIFVGLLLAKKQAAGFGDGEHRLTNPVGKRA